MPVDYVDRYGCTVAMIAAYYGIIKHLPNKYYHDPLFKDING